MQLKLKRAQRSAGMMGNKVIFVIQAHLDTSQLEQALIQKYGLGNLTVYNSAERRQHAEKAAAATSRLGVIAAIAMGSLTLQCTVNSLIKGQVVECKTLEEMMAAEEAITDAARNIKAYLDIASTFDGREVVVAID
jgi:hypothetical protein